MTWLSRLLPQSKGHHINTTDFNRRVKSRRRRMTLESLEDRVVLSNVLVTFDQPSGVLTITPDQFNNQFRITEQSTAAGGKVVVEALPVLPGVFQTTINFNATPFTSWEAVTKIQVNFTGGNDTDLVQLVGPGIGTNTTVRDVVYNMPGSGATTTLASGSSVTGVNNAGNFSLSTAGGLPGFSITNSQFQNLSIMQTGAAASVVTLTGDTVAGNVGVSLGNAASSRIAVTASNFGPTVLSQGTGAGDQITVSNSTLQNLLINQLSGAGDIVSVTNVGLSDTGNGLRVNQGAGNGNSITVTSVTTPTLAPPSSSTPPVVIPSIILTQGNGIGDVARVLSSAVEGDIRISQGNGYNNIAAITNSSAGFVVAASPPFIPTTTPVMGTAAIVQGNGSGLSAAITGGSFNVVSITQGTATNIPVAPPTPPPTPLPGSATVSGVSVYGNISITQNNASTAVAGTTATILNSPSTTGNIAITQAAAPGMVASISSSSASQGSVGISQGDGAGDRATITGLTAGTGSSISQGNGAGDQATLTNVLVLNGSVSLSQGNGAGDTATLSGLNVPLGGLTTTQGTGGGNSLTLGASTIGSFIPFGPYLLPIYGDVFITQLGGDNNTATIASTVLNSLNLTQGDSANGGGVANINGVTISNDLTVTQGGGSTLGNYQLYIGTSGNVSVGSSTTITQYGANNLIFLGAVLGGGTTFVTYSLSVLAGTIGGALVAARNVNVLDYFGWIDAGGTGNTFFDGGGNTGIVVSPNFSVFSF